MRVVKYSKDWERLGSCSIYGANTVYPFDGGSLRMAESDEYLFVHTCHEMYADSSGINHQANMSYKIRTDTMETLQSKYNVSNAYYDYVSHSFNQFVILDGNDIIKVDHGDAYPRSVTLYKKTGDAGSGSVTTGRVTLLEISGRLGNNYTGVTVGGAEASDGYYLAAGSSIDQSRFGETSRKNIFVASVPKDSMNDSDVVFRWITELPDENTTVLSTPQLVKIDGSRMMLLWTETASGSDGVLRYVLLDGSGAPVSEIYSSDVGWLSDCQPVVSGGKVFWYMTENTAANVFEIDLSDPGKVQALLVHGWKEESGGTVYYDNAGDKAFGWVTIGDAQQTYNWDTGEYEYISRNYYFNENGILQTGWLTVGGETYYLTETGYAVTGRVNIGDASYLFDKNGVMQTGWQEITDPYGSYNDETGEYESVTYQTYYGEDGKQYEGWLTEDGSTWYLDSSGKKKTGKCYIDGAWYLFNNDGVMQTGWQTVTGTFRFWDDEAKTWAYTTEPYETYFDEDGRQHNGWLNVNGKDYFLDSNGKKMTGYCWLNGQVYLFNEDGTLFIRVEGDVNMDQEVDGRDVILLMKALDTETYGGIDLTISAAYNADMNEDERIGEDDLKRWGRFFLFHSVPNETIGTVPTVSLVSGGLCMVEWIQTHGETLY